MASTKKITLNTRNSRRSIPIDSDAIHFQKLQKGLAIGYRKGIRGGSWFARRLEGKTYSREPLGTADDQTQADGITVFSFDQAQVKARQWFTQKAADDAGEVVAGNYTVAHAMADYLEKLREKRKSVYITQLQINAFILPRLGHLKLSELKYGQVKAWRDERARTPPRLRSGKEQKFREIDMTNPETMRRRQATANRTLTVLKAALNYAYKQRKIGTRAAWENVERFERVDVARIRFLNPKEAIALVENCAPDFALLVQGALATGARYSELAALKVDDFNAQQAHIYIAQSKNGDSRYIDLTNEGMALFKELSKNRQSSEHMFVKLNGESWKRSEQTRPMVDACNAAHIQGVTFHILRHSYASHAVMNGIPIKVVSEQLGHKSIEITVKHYAHLCPDYKKRFWTESGPVFGFTGVSSALDKPFIVPKVANAS